MDDMLIGEMVTGVYFVWVSDFLSELVGANFGVSPYMSAKIGARGL